MKKLVISVMAMLLTSGLMARETELMDIYTQFNKLYEAYGHDNNSLEMMSFASTDLAKISKELGSKKIVKLNSYSEQLKYVKQCVFMREGAYGEHITAQHQAAMAKDFIKYLDQKYILTPDMYVVYNVSFEIINNKCAILLVGELNNEALAIQGISVD